MNADQLNESALRCQRAQEHFDALQKFISDFLQENPPTARKEDALDGKTTYTFSKKLSNPSPMISVLIGELIYNLRSALDYIVYRLAIRDSGQPQTGTQFPIFDTSAVFGKNTSRYLRGIKPENVALFEKLQPYSGCAWTRLLRDLSNPDKHRHLVQTGRRTVYSMRFFNAETGEDSPVAREHTKFQFDNGGEVVETLRALIADVNKTVESFA